MNDNTPPIARIGPLMRLLVWLAGGDVDTARRCPPRDLEVFKVLALIMVATAAYQTAVLSLIGHRIFAPDGGVHPAIVVVATLIAAFILLIDSFTFMRAGWIGSGEKDLARAGLDLRSGWSDRVKGGIAVTVRLMLAVGLAELLAIFLALIIFSADITSRITERFLTANSAILGKVTTLVDGAIKRDEADVAAQSLRVTGLSAGIRALRDGMGDPSTNPLVMGAQAEVERYAIAKAKADDEVRAAEALAAGELSGARGPGYSGRPGRGPQRRAAEEQLASARARALAVGRDLEAARTRANAVRGGVAASSEATRSRSMQELPHLEAQLAAEDAKLAGARDHLTELVNGRGRAIRHGIESTPEHVPFDNGLISQIKVLEQITDGDRKLQALVFLIGFVGFGFELAGVLAKLTTHVPTTFAALTVRDHYLETVRIVDDLAEELDRRAEKREALSPLTTSVDDRAEPATGPRPLNDNPFGPASFVGGSVVEEGDKPAAEPVKRPRGRPRKQMLN